MSSFEDLKETLEGKEITRRKLISGMAAGGMVATAGCAVPRPQYTDFGRVRVNIPGGLPFELEDSIPLANYSDPVLESISREIHDTAEEDLKGPTVREVSNKVLMDTFYFRDDEILEAIQTNERLVGDRGEISQLLGNKHYATMRMGIKAAGDTRDIRQYLEKDLRSEYIDNISQPFRDAMKIAYDIGEPRFDIGGADERDSQFIGMEIYMLGNGNSKAGRYFNTTEIENYSSRNISRLESDLESEAEQPGGFEFYL